MNCTVCGDKGLVRVCYHDGARDDFGVCRCDAGSALRTLSNASRTSAGWPLWMAAAAGRGIPVDRVSMVEDILDDADLARIPPPTPATTRGSVAAAMQLRRPRL